MEPTQSLDSCSQVEQSNPWAEPFDLLLHLSCYSRKPILVKHVRVSEQALVLKRLQDQMHHTEWCVAKNPLNEAQHLFNLLKQRWPQPSSEESANLTPMEAIRRRLQALRYDHNNHVIVIDANLLTPTVWSSLLELFHSDSDIMVHSRLIVFTTPAFLKQVDIHAQAVCNVDFDGVRLPPLAQSASVTVPQVPQTSVAATLPKPSPTLMQRITGKPAQWGLTIVVITLLFTYWIQLKSHPEETLPKTVIEFAPPEIKDLPERVAALTMAVEEAPLDTQSPAAIAGVAEPPALGSVKQVRRLDPLPARLSAQRKQLMALPAEHYVLQMMAVRHGDKFLTAMERLHLGTQVHYYKMTYQDKAYYVLVYGDYPSLAEAKAALANLPPKVHAYRPWPRRVDSIHRSLNG